MADALNAITARAYVAGEMSAGAYRFQINTVEARKEDGSEFYEVKGAYDTYYGTFGFHWTVWLENGRLYGEW